jgi:predicted Ser/Thr protein kinase
MATAGPGNIARRLFLPPAYAEPLGDAATRNAFRFKRVLLLVIILGNVVIWLLLRGRPGLLARPLDAYLAINDSLLAVDLLVGELVLRGARRQRAWRAAVYLSAFLNAAVCVVFVQVTGSLTSYFLIGCIVQIVNYRLAFDFRAGAIALATLVALHLAVIVLEHADVLRSASLFAAPPGPAYVSGYYRTTAIATIVTFYVLAFLATNFVVNKFREKDFLIAAAQRDAARAADAVRLGRFSGQTLADRYELGEILGRGGMGEIYAGRRLSDGVEVAVKILHARLADDDTALERFRREADAASRLPGERIARILDSGRALYHGEPFIVMERLRGEDLGALLRREGRLAPPTVVRIVGEIAAGLEAAHAAGIVHRDLKPQNIFLTTDGSVRLLDFGISKMQGAGETLTQAFEVLGTPGFLAPEQAIGDLKVGPATDVFALGAIVYRALTGSPAFPAGDPAKAIFEACNLHPPPPSTLVRGLTAAVDDVLTLALAKDPQSRYASAGELAEQLATAVSGDLPASTRERARALRGGDATMTAQQTRSSRVTGT